MRIYIYKFIFKLYRGVLSWFYRGITFHKNIITFHKNVKGSRSKTTRKDSIFSD